MYTVGHFTGRHRAGIHFARRRLLGATAACALMAAAALQTSASAQVAVTSRTAEPTLAVANDASPPIPFADRIGKFALRGDHADDVAALRAFYSETSDRRLWVGDNGLTPRARAVIEEIGRADDWGLTVSSFVLPGDPTTGDAEAMLKAEAQISLAVMKYGRHARGGRFDPSKITVSLDRKPNLLPPSNVINGIASATEPDAYLRKLHPQHAQFEKLRQLYLKARAGTLEQPAAPVVEAAPEPTRKGKTRKAVAAKPATPPQITAERVLLNMEQWRWMPDNLGRLHVKANIPEFLLRVYKDGREIYNERVVTGTPANQTPIFSKDMEVVVFQPGWGVPSGIKVKELLPGLLAGRDPISGRGLVVRRNGREVSPHSIDWRATDIRKVSIVQPPGPSNALGQVKFLFPNKHDVYMHDTPAKGLFNSSVRAYSHGCVRVRNPMKFAEVLFAETDGWSPQRVASLSRGKPENEVPLPGHVEVHLTYFTVTVDDEGKAHTFRDIYGHERLIKAGLEGRAEQVAKKTEDLTLLRQSIVGNARNVRRTTYREDREERRQTRTVRNNRPSPRPSGGGGGGWFSLF